MLRIGVVGLGLVGGSLARDVATRGAVVLGHDLDDAALAAAVEEGVVHRALSAGLEGVEDADVLVLAVPVDALEGVLATALPHLRPECVVTDLGSTKRAAVETATRLGIGARFAGSHPLAGHHRSGWSASRTGLFTGAPVYLCPTPTTEPRVLETLRTLWLELGARPVEMDAAEHDRRLAWTSHLPQLASTALALALRAEGLTPEDLGPGGRDLTRLAASSPELWSGVCLENADLIEPALLALEARLRALRERLTGRDAPGIRALLEEGREWRG
jgi:prephenate dehydrogenase